MGFDDNRIITNYKYPFSKNKADLCVIDDDNQKIVFEMKCFVDKQDANKIQKYPEQTKMLERLLEYDDVSQIITFTTYIGYTENRMINITVKSHQNESWLVTELRKFVNEYDLYFIIGTITK